MRDRAGIRENSKRKKVERVARSGGEEGGGLQHAAEFNMWRQSSTCGGRVQHVADGSSGPGVT
jgi:hypothetical protein